MIDHRLGTTPEDLEAARLLAMHYTVSIKRPADAPAPERTDGTPFLAIPDWLDFCLCLPFDRSRRNRSWRRALCQSEAAWQAGNLTLDLHPAASFDENDLIDTLYFGLFVREFYSRGISPYGAHNLEAFRRLLAGPCLVATVRRGSAVIGAAVVRTVSPFAGQSRLLAGTSIKDKATATGMIFALVPAYRACRRALWSKLADALTVEGFTAFSLGRETPWLDARYAPVVIDKLRWADEVTAGSGVDRLWLSINTDRATNRRMVVFELNGDRFTLHGFGTEAVEMGNAFGAALGKAMARQTKAPDLACDSSCLPRVLL